MRYKATAELHTGGRKIAPGTIFGESEIDARDLASFKAQQACEGYAPEAAPDASEGLDFIDPASVEEPEAPPEPYGVIVLPEEPEPEAVAPDVTPAPAATPDAAKPRRRGRPPKAKPTA